MARPRMDPTSLKLRKTGTDKRGYEPMPILLATKEHMDRKDGKIMAPKSQFHVHDSYL